MPFRTEFVMCLQDWYFVLHVLLQGLQKRHCLVLGGNLKKKMEFRFVFCLAVMPIISY